MQALFLKFVEMIDINLMEALFLNTFNFINFNDYLEIAFGEQ
jgi:hypothetical protein